VVTLKLKEDRELVAGLIGSLSTIVAELVSKTLGFLKIGKYSTYELASMIITINRPSLIIGFIVSSFVGGILAVMQYYLFMKLHSENIIIKCSAFGVLMWIVLELCFTIFTEGKTIPVRPISAYYVHLISSIFFGITEGIFLKRIIFNESNM